MMLRKAVDLFTGDLQQYTMTGAVVDLHHLPDNDIKPGVVPHGHRGIVRMVVVRQHDYCREV